MAQHLPLSVRVPIEEDNPSICRNEALCIKCGMCKEVCTQQIGRTEEVLVESESARDAGCVCGKTGRGHMVNFAGDTALIGRFAQVEITSAGRNTLRGRLIAVR